MGSSAVSAAQALLLHPLLPIPLASNCLQILVGSWAQAFQSKATPFAAQAGIWANSGSSGYGLGLLLSNRGSGSLICK